jgi:hypothetical protein
VGTSAALSKWRGGQDLEFTVAYIFKTGDKFFPSHRRMLYHLFQNTREVPFIMQAEPYAKGGVQNSGPRYCRVVLRGIRHNAR